MDFCKIKSKDNDAIKLITQLQKSSKHRKESGLFVLEGLRLCEDAIDNGYSPEMVIVSTTFMSVHRETAEKFSLKSKKNYETSDDIFKKISDTTTPQGILCVYKIPHFGERELSKSGKYVVLENLQDPSNLGAISRTAEALGINGIILDGGCDPYSSKSLRASMGALLRIPVLNISNCCEMLKNKGIITYAAVVNDKEALKLGDIVLNNGIAVFIGNEANGIKPETSADCDHKITIPMRGNAESLNAAVAASIIMWEMCK